MSLWNYTKQKSLPGRVPSYINRICKSKKHYTQKETPPCTFVSGVLTVEAALVLPLLITFFLTILFLFRILQVQLEVQKALDDAGRKLAIYTVEEENESIELARAKALFMKELIGRKQAERYIEGGILGIALGQSDFSDENISLCATYRIPFPIGLLPMPDIWMTQRACCRKWNGYNYTHTVEGDVWVYVTDTGSVYHTSRECSHIQLSVQSVLYDELKEKRNENGEKYRKCERCVAKNNKNIIVYITNQGDCYHQDLNCSGIKRTIFMIRLSEITDYRGCSKCAIP